jgi:PPM family protein phosphatase
MYKLEICYKTRRGSKREINEDSLVVSKFDDLFILAIADGMGGHAAGEVASRVAIKELVESLKLQPWRSGLQESFSTAILKANMAIYLLSKENQNYMGMASTLVAAAISPKESIVANVGDSRAYLVGPKIKKITRDHSLVQQMVDNCLITEEESFSHHQKNIITMNLGRRREIHPDFYPIVLSGMTLLLCSDGLSNALREEEIGNIVTNSCVLEEACNSLIKTAEYRGATDDITVIMAREDK